MPAPLVKMANAELLVSAFFRADPDVLAAQGDATFTVLPSGFKDWPATVVTRVGGTPAFSDPLWIDQPLIQVSCYGGSKSTAYDVAETQRAALAARDRLPFTVAGVGRLDCVLRFGGIRDVPDPSWDPARPRWIWEFTCQTRPIG